MLSYPKSTVFLFTEKGVSILAGTSSPRTFYSNL